MLGGLGGLLQERLPDINGQCVSGVFRIAGKCLRDGPGSLPTIKTNSGKFERHSFKSVHCQAAIRMASI
jgi:hypothetical protein